VIVQLTTYGTTLHTRGALNENILLDLPVPLNVVAPGPYYAICLWRTLCTIERASPLFRPALPFAPHSSHHNSGTAGVPWVAVASTPSVTFGITLFLTHSPPPRRHPFLSTQQGWEDLWCVRVYHAGSHPEAVDITR